MRCAASKLACFAVSLGVALAPRPARAQVVKLEDLEQRALQNRGAMAAARARVSGADARIDLAKVPYYPTLAATVGATVSPGSRLIKVPPYAYDTSTGVGKIFYDSQPYTVAGSRALGEEGAFDPIFRYDTTLTFASRLYDFGRTASSVRAARADREASLADERAERLSVAIEVRAAYLTWLSADGTRDILAESAKEATALRASVEAHVAAGATPGADLASASFDEARAELDLERSEGDLTSARFDVEQATGAPLSKSAEPDRSLLDGTPPPDSPVTHPEVSALERRRDAAVAAADSHGYAHAPVLAIGAAAGLHGQQSTPFPLYQAGVTVTVPVLDGGLESASAAQASSQAKELDAQAREMRAHVSVQNERARSSLASAERRLALAERLVAAAEESVKHAEDQHELGAATFDAVVQARMQASRARLEVLGARVERARAVLDLKGAATH
jgi:outer membrane protein TolC